MTMIILRKSNVGST